MPRMEEEWDDPVATTAGAASTASTGTLATTAGPSTAFSFGSLAYTTAATLPPSATLAGLASGPVVTASVSQDWTTPSRTSLLHSQRTPSAPPQAMQQQQQDGAALQQLLQQLLTLVSTSTPSASATTSHAVPRELQQGAAAAPPAGVLQQPLYAPQAAPVIVSTLPPIKEFDLSRPAEWPRYASRLAYQCPGAQGMVVTPEMKRAHFLSYCGDDMYNLSPLELTAVPYDDIIARLTEHSRPKVNEVAAYYRFHHTVQKASQTVSEFVAELRRFDADVGFGPLLDKMLLFQFVCGLRDGGVRSRLLQRSDLTLHAAVDVASRAESAQQHVREMTPTLSAYALDSAQPDAPQHVKCYRCAGPHMAYLCQVDPWSLSCSRCNGRRHVAEVCQSEPGKQTNSGAKPKQGDRTNFANSKKSGKSSGKPPAGEPQNAPPSQSQPNAKKTASGSTAQPPAAHRVAVHPGATPPLDSNVESGKAAADTLQLTVLEAPAPDVVTLTIHDKAVQFEVDNGAAVAVLPKAIWESLWTSPPALEPLTMQLQGYGASASQISILGVAWVSVCFKDKSARLPLVIADGCRPIPLLGRNWFAALGISVVGIHSVEGHPGPSDAAPSTMPLSEHPALRCADNALLGCYTGPSVTLDVDPAVPPRFLRARPVSFPLQSRVIEEIHRLQAAGVWRPTRFSSWATPIVVVLKKDGGLRLCGDYKATINKALLSDKYPLPPIDDTLVKFAGCSVFTKLDLERAFTQLPVDDAGAQLQTVNTILGLFTVHRVQFGIKVAPAVLQRIMEGGEAKSTTLLR